MTEKHAVAYDSEGRLLVLAVVEKERPPSLLERTFGLRASPIEAVKITSGEDRPGHEPQLRDVLVGLLRRYAGETGGLENMPLEILVRRSVEYLGLTC